MSSYFWSQIWPASIPKQ